MSISIRIRAGDKNPFSVNINSLPQRVEVSKASKNISTILPMIIIPLLFLLVFLSSFFGLMTALPIVLVLGAVIGLLGWRAVSRTGRPDIMDFGHDGVKVVEAGLWRDNIWQAPYSAFEGVVLRERGARAKGATQATYQIIELHHVDPQKILPLYVKKESEAPAERWQAYARLFNLPAIEV